jgi:hypothetical protein
MHSGEAPGGRRLLRWARCVTRRARSPALKYGGNAYVESTLGRLKVSRGRQRHAVLRQL